MGVKQLELFAPARATARKVGLELVTLASPISMMKDIYFLCRRPFQAQVKTAEGLYLNFVRNSGGVLVPTGSNLLGGDWTLDITDKARSLKLDAYVEMLKTEYKWLWNNVTASTGGAGVLTGDLAAHDYSFDNYSQAGFEYFTIDGVDVGEFNSPHLVVKSVATKKDHRGRSINRRTSAVLSFNMLQTTVNEHLAVATTASHDKTIIGYTYDGEQFKFTAGAGSVSMKTEMGDKDNFITLTIGGEVLNNPLEGTETSLKFSGTPPNIMEFVMINY